jgi:broad specificity phosphatase PhoE
MGKMELILIRHGETDWNKDGVFRGQMDVKLNAMGIAQADATANALASKVFEAIYTSPLKRALVTARRIAKPHEMVERVDNGLMDISFGRFQGLTEAEVTSRYPGQLKVWKENPGKAKFPGGESVKKAWKRINSSLREILVVHGYGTVVIVSHRVPIKMMTAYLLGKDRYSIGEIKHDHCAISVFEIDGRDYEPIVLNDSGHLSKLGVLDKKDF